MPRAGGQAGAITLSGSDVTTTGKIFSLGGEANPNYAGGSGANVSITATDGTPLITIGGDIKTYGAYAGSNGNPGVGGNINLNDNVKLNADNIRLTSYGGRADRNGGNITFGGTVTGTSADNLTVNAGTHANNGTATVTFSNAVGTGGQLANIEVTGGTKIVIQHNITTTGNQTYNSPIEISVRAVQLSTGNSSSGDINIVGNITGHQNLTFDAGTGTSSLTAANSINITGVLNNSSGNFDTNGDNLTTSGLHISGGTFNSGNDAGAWDINGDVAIVSGATLNATTGAFNVAGNWSNSGTFVHNNSKVTLDGTNQSISGATSFYDLSKQSSAADTLTFQHAPANKTIITNILTLKGADGQLLALRSDSDGVQWEIDPQSTRTLAYLDVKDSKNVNATDIDAGTSSFDSGNNTKWNFPSASTVTTQAVSNVAPTTATGNGNVTDLGAGNVTQHGVCWSTTVNPTIADSKTEDGSVAATGPFTSSITGLSENTTYYVRAYSTNSFGTSYGAEVSFKTFPIAAISKADGDWNSTSTWVGDVVPTSGQTATINNQVTIAADVDINGITVNAGDKLSVNGTSTLTVAGNINIDGELSIANGTVDVNGAFDATGGNVTFTGAGNLKLAGAVTSLGTFAKGTGTVTYDGADQNIDGYDYYNLVFGGSGNKTLAGNIGIENTFAINAGTFVHNDKTVTYNGGDQTILALDYYTLALSGTGSTKTFANGTTSVATQISLTDTITLTGSSSSAVNVQVTTPGTTIARVFYIDASGKNIKISDMTIKGGTRST